MNHPLFLLLMTAAGLYMAKLWNDDRRSPHDRALPGAAAATPRAIWIAVIGAWLVLAIETYGEKALGLADQQTKLTWLFAVYSILGAPIVEELIFRGYLVVQGKGRALLWASAVGASFAFAALHPFLWHSGEKGIELTFTAKGWFSTAAVFVTSLWLYVARFGTWNQSQSLLPCFVGHAAKNIGVVAIKAFTGYMGGLW